MNPKEEQAQKAKQTLDELPSTQSAEKAFNHTEGPFLQEEKTTQASEQPSEAFLASHKSRTNEEKAQSEKVHLQEMKNGADALNARRESSPKNQKAQAAKAQYTHSKKKIKGPHNNESMPMWQKPFHALGAWFYFLGFAAECRVRWFSRIVSEAFILFVQLGLWVLRNVSLLFVRLFKEVLHSIIEPFVRIKKGLSNIRRVMRDEQKKAGGSPVKAAFLYFKAGMQSHGHLFENLVSIFAPGVAVLVLVFLAYSVINTQYGLEVSIQGETIGYIENETVLEDAKAILRGRLRLAGDQNMEDWQFDSTLELARADAFTTQDQLVNAMLLSGSAEVVEATGLYVDNELLAITQDGEELSNYLNDTLDAFAQQVPEDAEVSFVNTVECDPEADEVFLNSGLQSFDELLTTLDSTVREEVSYTVQEGDTLGDIAGRYNLLFETLLLRNPQFEGEDIDFVPEEGTELLIQRAEPFLQVQTIVQDVYTETLPFPVEEQPVDDKPEGFRGVLQTGEDGVQQVQDELIYIDGELVERTRQTDLTSVVQEPVPEIVQIGTVDVTSRTLNEFSPVYTWPVPDYLYSSRGGGPGMSHRGRDINAPEGTPVYACNAGVVTTAGWHDSYGNYVVIDHPDGLRTLYAHNSFLHVTEGQEVMQNELIANVGNTGFSFGAHLHLEFQEQSGALLNPDDYVVAPHGF